jgi:lipid-A-disaccharide synthase
VDQKNLMIVAGEKSGDMLGAGLVRELLAREPGLHVVGMGGPQMKAAGVELMKDLTEHATMGVAGLLGQLGGLFRAYRQVIHRLNADRPDAIILIDFAEFNLIVARHAKRIGVPVIFYVSPQVWAWRTGRIKKIAHRGRKMLCFFDFEKELYEKAGMDVTHVGHPLLDALADKMAVTDRTAVRSSLGLPESGTVVGLLPGSRRKEIEHIFPVLLGAAKILQSRHSDLSFVVPRAEHLDPEPFYKLGERAGVDFTMIDGRAHDVMLASDLLLICSGTATLEAGLLGTPMVVTYKADRLSYTIFGLLVKPGNLALVNIAAGETICPECYMIDATPEKISAEASKLLDGGLDEMRAKLGTIRDKLGQPGAPARAAEEILKII